MIMNIAVVLVILGLGYLWLTRGAFSAFLHLACTVAAGAIAFAAWEPLALLLVGVLPSTGFFGFLHGLSWAVALLVPFALALVVLRIGVDQVVKGNMQLPGAAEPVLGGVFGLAAGLLTVGVGVIGISHARLSTTFAGYQPMWYTEDKAAGAGSLVATDTLWIPADKLTAALYRHTSDHSFSAPSESLARWYPNLHAAGFVNRVSPKEGSGRNVVKPEDFSLVKRYTVGEGSTPAKDLLTDRWRSAPQKYLDINGEPVASGQIHGFVFKFEAGAKESGKSGPGPVVLSNGQMRLVAENVDGETVDIFPLAAIGEASSGSGEYGRYVYDAAEVFIASVGAGDPTMAVEFLVPSGYEPIGLFFRGVRVTLDDSAPEPTTFGGTSARDRLIPGGELIKGGQPTLTLDRSGAVTFDGPTELEDRNNTSGLMRTNAFGWVVNVSKLRGPFRVADDTNLILEGQGEFFPADFGRRNAPRERALRADKFGVARDQIMFQLDVSVGKAGELVSGIPAETGNNVPLRLVTTSGEVFDALGFTYEDTEKIEVRYTPSDPIEGMGELPSLSTSDPERKLVLLFVVSRGVDIEAFAIGDRAVILFDAPAPAVNN